MFSNGRYVLFYARTNITRTFCKLVERWDYIDKWKLMDLSREPYGCVRHVDDSACLQSSENILQLVHMRLPSFSTVTTTNSF